MVYCVVFITTGVNDIILLCSLLIAEAIVRGKKSNIMHANTHTAIPPWGIKGLIKLVHKAL